MNNLLGFSEGASLAFHGLAMIAEKAPERINVKYIANELCASEAHLAKIFQKLTKAGIISSVRGPAGGFVLNRSAEAITFLDIYEIIESKVEMTGCPLSRTNCSFSKCIFDERMSKIRREVYELLKDIKLSDFQGS